MSVFLDAQCGGTQPRLQAVSACSAAAVALVGRHAQRQHSGAWLAAAARNLGYNRAAPVPPRLRWHWCDGALNAQHSGTYPAAPLDLAAARDHGYNIAAPVPSRLRWNWGGGALNAKPTGIYPAAPLDLAARDHGYNIAAPVPPGPRWHWCGGARPRLQHSGACPTAPLDLVAARDLSYLGEDKN